MFDRSGGNAYLVEELAGVVRGGGDPADLPPSLRDVLLSRVDALSPARSGCCAPPRWPGAGGAGPAAGRRWPGLGEAELFAALREAVENHLLLVDPSGHGYAFRHALTRDAVYEDMLPGERVRLHAAYGEALERDPALAGDDAGLPAALAYHWYAALDLPRALPAAIDAARHAMASYAPAEALRHLERALEIWPRVPDAGAAHRPGPVEVSRLAAEAAYRAGALEPGRCRLLADALAELPAGAGPDTRRALLLERRAQAQRDAGRPRRRWRAAAGAGPAARREPDDPAHAVVLAALASALMRVDEIRTRRDDGPGGRWRRPARPGPRRWRRTRRSPSARPCPTWTTTEAACGPLRSGLAAGAATAGVSYDRAARLRQPVRRAGVLRPAHEAAQAARGRAGPGWRAGLARTLGSYLIGNLAEPLLRLGRWAEVDGLTRAGPGAVPEGVFARHPGQLRAELAAMRGRYDDAASRAAGGTPGARGDQRCAVHPADGGTSRR